MPVNLSHQVLKSDASPFNGDGSERVWIEVIQKMDEVYADLLHHQVEIEEKNAALEEAHSFIRGVLTSMSDILIVIDLNGIVQQGNRPLAELKNCSEASLIGCELHSLFDHESGASVDRCLESIREGESGEYEVLIADGEGAPTPFLVRCSPQYDHEGVVVGMVLIGRPIGELRKAYNELHQTHKELQDAQMQLVQSEKMASLGRLVAGVAHELNNPISFVHSNMFAIKKYGFRLREYIEMLHEQLGDQAHSDLRSTLKIDRILDDIPSLVDGGLEGTDRVSKIVQDLRRFSTSHREEEQEFDLTAVVTNAARWVVKTAQVRAKLNVAGDPLIVSNYEGFIHQVIVNLIQNGLDAMEGTEHPKIDVYCWQQDEYGCIQIRDYGTGISDEDMLKVFDPFFTTKEVGKGTGLGLYVSYGLIVEQCRGQMDVKNHADGGAVFSLKIPLLRDHEHG